MADITNQHLEKKYRGAVGLALALVNVFFQFLIFYILISFNLVYLDKTQNFLDFIGELIPFVFGLSVITVIAGMIYFIAGFKYSSRWVRIISFILYTGEIVFLALPSISESLFFKFIFWLAYLGT